MPDLTVTDLGQKVKAKYPGQYDDLSDADVGRKVKAKFPGQYDDFKDTQSTLAERQAASRATAEENAPQYPWYSRYLSNETLGKAQQAVDAILHTSDSPSVKADSMLAAITPGGPETEGMGLMEGLKASPAAQAVSHAAESVSNAAGSAWDKIKGLIPSTERAGEKFSTVMGAAKDVPLDTSEAQQIAERAQELASRGASAPPKPLRDFLKNQAPVTAKFGGQKVTMEAQPMTYEVGRDFASNASRVSADEALKASPQMKAQLAQFADAMKTANRQAAESVGMGDLYDQAMKEYRAAKNFQEGAEIIKKWAIRAAIGTAATAAGVKAAKAVFPGLGQYVP